MNLPQFVRYGLSSGLTWIVDFVAFMVFYRFFGIPISLLLSRFLAGIVGYCCHKWYSFESKSRAARGEVFGYITLASINYALSIILVQSLPHYSDAQVALAKIGAELAIFIANFLFLRRLFLTDENSSLT